MKKLQGVFDKVLTVIADVEKMVPPEEGKDFYTGEEKRAMAVAAINACIDIPMLPEFIEAKIFTKVIGLLVDFAVYIHNRFDLFVKEKKAEKVAKPAKVKA